mmetsp:Transcript_3808/g.14093  ORF Transcript_3808/g.14093 Transcript_3808/m.14093 type:complete len:298 (+) Transcript_3808:778-1671(+)
MDAARTLVSFLEAVEISIASPSFGASNEENRERPSRGSSRYCTSKSSTSPSFVVVSPSSRPCAATKPASSPPQAWSKSVSPYSNALSVRVIPAATRAAFSAALIGTRSAPCVVGAVFPVFPVAGGASDPVAPRTLMGSTRASTSASDGAFAAFFTEDACERERVDLEDPEDLRLADLADLECLLTLLDPTARVASSNASFGMVILSGGEVVRFSIRVSGRPLVVAGTAVRSSYPAFVVALSWCNNSPRDGFAPGRASSGSTPPARIVASRTSSLGKRREPCFASLSNSSGSSHHRLT